MGSALSSAFLMGGAARYGAELEKDVAGASRLSSADPYFFSAPLMVEGNPGQLAPDSLELPIITLAGAAIASGKDATYVVESLGLRSSSSLLMEEDGPYTLSVVWTPRMENMANAPPYYNILNIFQDLMYWRGLLFGLDSMSPATFMFTTEKTAQERGQQFVR
jgi:hypothetical protein